MLPMLEKRRTTDWGMKKERNGIAQQATNIQRKVFLLQMSKNRKIQTMAANHAPRDQVKTMQAMIERIENKHKSFCWRVVARVNSVSAKGRIITR